MAAADKPNLNKWKDFRLAALVEAENKAEKKKEGDAKEIGPVQKLAKPKTDNEGHREIVEILGKRFYLDNDNVTSRTGHTFSWVEIMALYEYGKENGYTPKE